MILDSTCLTSGLVDNNPSIVKESNRLRVKMPLCKSDEAPEIYSGFSLVEIGDNFWIPPKE